MSGAQVFERGRYRWVPAGVGRLGVPPWTAAEPTNPSVASQLLNIPTLETWGIFLLSGEGG